MGKITTPIWVIEKVSKLDTPFNRIELIRTRLEGIEKNLIIDALRKKLALSKHEGKEEELQKIDEELERKSKELEEEMRILCECNHATEMMEDELLAKLLQIARKIYNEEGVEKPYITEGEVYHLSVRRGNLTEEEIGIMRSHINWTKKMLAQMPFSRHLKNVPLYAGQHHEKLNGTGYPEGLTAKNIPLQSRILAVADLYEALTAKDRPYKKQMPTEKVLDLLKNAATKGELDPDVVDLLIHGKVHEKFEEEYRNLEKT